MSTFAKSLRLEALARIDRSPALRRAYAQRRKPWTYRAPQLVCAVLGLPLFCFTGCMFGMMAAFASLGPVPAAVLEGKPPAHPFSVELGLAAHSLLVTFVAALSFTAFGRECFFPNVQRLAYLPVEDDKSAGSDGGCFMTLLIPAVMCGFVFRVATIHHGLPWPAYVAIIPLAALHAWMLYVLAIIAVDAFRPTRLLRTEMGWIAGLAFTCYGTAMFMALASRWVPAHLQHTMSHVGLLSPVGWADAILWHGVVCGQAWAWLLLIPCAAVSTWALWRRSRLPAIHEICISPQGAFTPVFADEIEELCEPPPLVEPATVPRVTPLPPAIDRQAALRRLLKSGELAGSDWSNKWLLERWFGALLSPRDRQVIECLRGGVPRWTLTWLCQALAVVAWAALVGWLSYVVPPEDRRVHYMLFTAPAWAALLELPRRFQRPPRSLAALSVFPIGLREMIIGELKLAGLRLAVFLPMLAAYLLVSGLFIGHLVALLASSLGIATSVMLAVALLGPGFRLGSRTRFELSIHRYVYLLLLTCCIGGVYAMLMTSMFPLPLVSVSLAISVIATAALGCVYFDWLHQRGRFDYLAAPPVSRPKGTLFQSA